MPNFHCECVFELDRRLDDEEIDKLFEEYRDMDWVVTEVDYCVDSYVTIEFPPNYVPDSLQIKNIHELLNKRKHT